MNVELAQQLKQTSSFSWISGMLAVNPQRKHLRIRMTGINEGLLESFHVPDIKDAATVGALLHLVVQHPRVFRITKLGMGDGAIPEKRSFVEVSLHDATGFHAEGQYLGELLAQVLLRLDG